MFLLNSFVPAYKRRINDKDTKKNEKTFDFVTCVGRLEHVRIRCFTGRCG